MLTPISTAVLVKSAKAGENAPAARKSLEQHYIGSGQDRKVPRERAMVPLSGSHKILVVFVLVVAGMGDWTSSGCTDLSQHMASSWSSFSVFSSEINKSVTTAAVLDSSKTVLV